MGKYLNGHFIKENIEMANKYMKRCLTLWSLGDVNQNHNAVPLHTIRMANNENKNKSC